MRYVQGIFAVNFPAPLAFLLTLSVLAPTPALALPRESRVPGGIAVLRLPPALDDSSPPRAWLGERRVWITRENGAWHAIVGMGLDTPPGTHELRVESGNEHVIERFDIVPKRYAEQRISLKDAGKVRLSPEDEARASVEIRQIQEIKRSWRDAEDTADRLDPPATGRMSGVFGSRRIFNGEARAPHNGLDIAVSLGTPIRASAEGTVLAVDDYFFNGKTVFVDHGNGLITMVCHLGRIDVRVGDRVRRDQILGLSGMSGRASGPHVHWSVILNGVMVDPLLFMPAPPAQSELVAGRTPPAKQSLTRRATQP